MNEKTWCELSVAIVMEGLVSRTPHHRDTPAFRKQMEREVQSACVGSWTLKEREAWEEETLKKLIKHFKLNPHPHPIY